MQRSGSSVPATHPIMPCHASLSYAVVKRYGDPCLIRSLPLGLALGIGNKLTRRKVPYQKKSEQMSTLIMQSRVASVAIPKENTNNQTVEE